MAMLLGDDGTLDTVIVCSECGAEMRYSHDGDFDGDSDDRTDEQRHADFVAWAKEDSAEQHECEGKEG